MTVQLRQPRITKRPWTGRDAAVATATLAATRPTAEAAPSRREPAASDGCEDRALYHCHCGYVFVAAVTAGVDCPHCGSAQAW
jgi:hypothetical protein